MTLTRADLIDLDPEVIRDTALCYGLDGDDMADDELFNAFAELLDDQEMLSHG